MSKKKTDPLDPSSVRPDTTKSNYLVCSKGPLNCISDAGSIRDFVMRPYAAVKTRSSSSPQHLSLNDKPEETADVFSVIPNPRIQRKLVRHCKRRFLRPWNPCITCKYHIRVFTKIKIGKKSIPWYKAKCIFPDCPNSWFE